MALWQLIIYFEDTKWWSPFLSLSDFQQLFADLDTEGLQNNVNNIHDDNKKIQIENTPWGHLWERFLWKQTGGDRTTVLPPPCVSISIISKAYKFKTNNKNCRRKKSNLQCSTTFANSCTNSSLRKYLVIEKERRYAWNLPWERIKLSKALVHFHISTVPVR